MKFDRIRRLVALSFLFLALFSLLVLGGVDRPPAPELGRYPGLDDVVERPETLLGDRVSVIGQVVATDPLVISAQHETETGVTAVRITVTDSNTAVERGDRVQVFGVLTDTETIRAINVVVLPQSGLWYSWIVSFIAGLWVLGRIVRHWRIDREQWAFVPRADPWRPGGNHSGQEDN